MSNFFNIIKRDAISIGIILGINVISLIILSFMPSETAQIIGSAILSIICLPLASIYIFKKKGYDFRNSVFIKPQKISIKAIIYITACVLVMMGVSLLIGTFAKIFGIVGGNNGYEDLPKISLVILSCVIAPISEEIYFRLGLSSLSSTSPNIIEDVVSACVFSLFHLSLLHSPYYFILSLLCVYGVRKYENLWVSIIIHTILNLIMVSLLV